MREKQSMSRGGADRGRHRIRSRLQALWAVSTESDMGLEPTNLKIMAWAKVGHLTDWATQAPLASFPFPDSVVKVLLRGGAVTDAASVIPLLYPPPQFSCLTSPLPLHILWFFMEWELSLTQRGKDRVAVFPFIFIKPEMTTLPNFLIKQPPGALRAQGEGTAQFFTKLYAKGLPGTGQEEQLKARGITKCLRRNKSNDQPGKISMAGSCTVHNSHKALCHNLTGSVFP